MTAGFPPDTRPDGFPFDDHAAARLVGSDQADAYRRAAQSIAQAASQDLSTIVPCDGSGDTARACAAQFLQRFGSRVFRRPLLQTEIERYQKLIIGQPTFAAGIALALSALLQSPHFLYRSELGEPQPDGSYRLSSYEVASALSYLYLGTMPDDELFAAAARNELHDAATIERHARRLLARPRAQENLSDFAVDWLGVARVLTVDKRGDLFAGFDAVLRAALVEETRRFTAHVAFAGSGRLAELFTADYSFLNQTLVRHYGVAAASGGTLQKTSYGPLEVARSGLLGHGSVLASYAHSDQTSPIRRGLFVRRNLLCQELPAPPPNAGGVPKVDAAATSRERFRQHSNNPFCRTCHQYIDGVGFGFERFDAVGAARTVEAGQPIDGSGDINDINGLGSHINAVYTNLPELGEKLAGSERAQTCFVRQYLRFSRGQSEDVAADLCTLDRLNRRFAERGARIVELMVEVTQLPEFLYRR